MALALRSAWARPSLGRLDGVGLFRCVVSGLVALFSVGLSAREGRASPVPSDAGERASPNGEPSGKHCLDGPGARWISAQTLVVQAAPQGAELELKLGACLPLIRGQGELFDYTHLVVGLDAQLTAGYAQVGPYVELLPLSMLGLRAELHGVQYFPGGFPSAGYYPRAGYDARFGTDDLPAGESESATGFNVVALAWLQLEVELGGPLTLFVWDEFALEHWSLGAGPYYYNMRWDVILASSDELLRNDAYVGVSTHLGPELTMRLGPVSAVRHVPAAHYTAHQLGGALSSRWQTASGSLRAIDGLLAVGAFVDHSFRRGAFATFVLTADWDLAPL